MGMFQLLLLSTSSGQFVEFSQCFSLTFHQFPHSDICSLQKQNRLYLLAMFHPQMELPDRLSVSYVGLLLSVLCFLFYPLFSILNWHPCIRILHLELTYILVPEHRFFKYVAFSKVKQNMQRICTEYAKTRCLPQNVVSHFGVKNRVCVYLLIARSNLQV